MLFFLYSDRYNIAMCVMMCVMCVDCLLNFFHQYPPFNMSGTPRPPSDKKTSSRRRQSTEVMRTSSRRTTSLVESPSSVTGLGSRKETTTAGGWMYNRKVSSGQTAVVNATLKLPENDPALDRVFNTHQRIFPFSHRPLLSIRHPFVRHSVMEYSQQLTSQGSPNCLIGNTITRRGKTIPRIESSGQISLLNRLKPRSSQLVQSEERKWVEISHLFDVIALEDELLNRRAAILSNSLFCRQVDRIWSALVLPKQVNMSQSTYIDINCQMWRLFIGKYSNHSTELFNIITSSGEADWHTDSSSTSGTGLTYGDFTISLLEVADNWCESPSPASYVKCVTEVADAIVASVALPPPTSQDTWNDKKQIIHRNYCSGLFDGCIPQSLGKVRSRPVTNLAEYYLDPLPEGL